MNTKVEDIIDNGQWKLDAIESIVNGNTHDDILAIVLPVYSQTSDHPSWVNSLNGNCTASTAYEFLDKDSSDTKGLKWFWKLKIP